MKIDGKTTIVLLWIGISMFALLWILATIDYRSVNIKHEPMRGAEYDNMEVNYG